MSNKDWQIGPVLKDKMGSQGTLFRGGTKYSSPKRFPKGYTPERQAEVADAVVRPSVTVNVRTGTTKQYGTASKEFKDRFVRTSGDMSTAPMVHDSRQPVRDLVDNIARSTVPVEHLSGVQFRFNASREQLGATAAAHWDPGGDAMTKGGPVIRLGPGTERTNIAIHEIGHHVSHTMEGNTFPRDENGHSGPEEAHADNYAETHFRDNKGNPQSRGTYGGGQFAGHIQRTESFWDGYHKQRDSSMYRDYVARENEKYYGAWPEEKIHPDDSQDVPLIEKEWISPDDRARGVKPEININPDAEPEHWSSKYAW
jgi:hypothetical protein